MNKLFMGLFTVLTVFAGMATIATHPVSKGDTINNLGHEAALRSVTQAAILNNSVVRSVRVGSAGYSSGSYSRGGYSGGSYRGGK